MCRSTDFPRTRPADRDRLKIRGFYIRFSNLTSGRPFPEFLTLLYLPRISENSLEIDGSKIRPDLPAFLTLHRVVSDGPDSGAGAGATYGSRDRVAAGEGLRFEVHVAEEKALKGVFRRDEYGEWAMECKCTLETASLFGCGAEAEVCVATEGRTAMVEKVGMAVKRRRRKAVSGFRGLEEIPEEREVEGEPDDDCCCCSCCGEKSGSEAEDAAEYGGGKEYTEDMDLEVNTEGVKWAVDVGIWVMCLGVGILVSKASARRLRRIRLL